MIPIWILVGLIISGTSVSMLGAYFSIKGLGALFSGAMFAVWLMAGSLELSKFVLAAYLHRQWKRMNSIYKSYLVSSVVILSLITSMGIFGFLSEAYQSASAILESENIKMQSLQVQVTGAQNEINRLNRSIDEIPANRVTKRIQARKEVEPTISEKTKQIEQLNIQISQAQMTMLEAKKKVGPLIYISKAFNLDIDVVVKYLILIFVLVFDPLAICLVIAISESLISRGLAPTEAASQAPPTADGEVIKMKFVSEDDKTAV
jgi:hypothetical protein